MGLAAPWALALGLLAALPVIAHLVRRRDVPEVALPTIALLERARVRTRRRARIVDLLLLALRIAIVVVAALAVAGPYTVVRPAWGDGTRASIALVVDDSLSMARREHGRTLLAAARDRAASIVASLPEGSEVCLVLAGAPARVLVARTTALASAAAALRALDVDTPTRGTDAAGGVQRALRELAGSRNEARSVVVLGDAARHAHLDALPEPGDVGVEVLRIGGAPGPDVAVVDATPFADPTRPGDVQVLVTLQASGGAQLAGRTVRIEDATGAALASATVGAQAGGDGTARVTIPGVRLAADDADPRARAVVVVPGGDTLPADDARGVLLRRTTGVHVVVVAPSPAAARDVVRALDLAPADLGPFTREVIDADALATHDNSTTDVVVLLAPPRVDAATTRALEGFVARGGGLAIAAGEGTDDAALRQLAALLPCSVGGATTLATTVGLRAGDAGGPWSEIADAIGLADTAVHRRLVLETPPPGSLVPLRFADGPPALVVASRGAGRTALLATSLDESWSDLPLRPGFLPLVVRLVRALAGPTSMRATLAPGTPVALALPPGARELTVESPSGRRVARDDDGVLRDTTELGAWRVRVADEAGHARDAARLAFVVAPPNDELDLAVAPLPPTSRGTRGHEDGATVRRSLTPWLWLVAGLLVALEGVVRLRPRVRSARTPA